MPMRLVRPGPEHESAFLAMQADYLADGDERYQEVDRYQEWQEAVARYVSGEGLPPDRARQDTYFLVDDGAIIYGVVRLRHELKGMLLQIGGHIGYDVPPSQRRRGYGTLCLALILDKAREIGLTRVLVTCDSDNTGSARIIEKNGGQLENEIYWQATRKNILRYWITL